jgi:hypothetical protein
MMAEDKFARWLAQAHEVCTGNPDHLAILAAVEKLVQTDPAPYDEMISKLVALSGRDRKTVAGFVKAMRGVRG